MSEPVWGVVLAAGASTRMGSSKALATLGGETFVARAARALREGGCARVLVVVAEPHGASIDEALGDVELLWNPDPARGQLSSLKLAIERSVDCKALVVALVDHPRVQPQTVTALIDAHRARGASLVRPRNQGRHGHPYLVDQAVFGPILAAADEGGARPVLSALTSRESVDVDDAGIHDDLDTAHEARAVGAEPS